MAKPKTAFFCSQCGADNGARWSGQCSHCQAWNTLTESVISSPADGRGPRKNWAGASSGRHSVQLGSVEVGEDALRMSTGVGEFDRVLGGGLVVGGVVLVGGDPGIGKSTILLQAAYAIGAGAQGSVLYVTGEESLPQVAARARRLGLDPSVINAIAETHVEQIQQSIQDDKPKLVIIDSIQTLYTDSIQSAPGTVSQVRESAALLTRQAKQMGVALFLVGHVTKDGSIAGPRVLEHMVDTVLQFEGDPQSPYRLIRSVKNRFGAANEIGAFEMTSTGLVSVDDPSALFLAQDRKAAQGACVCVLQEGPRPLLIEIQALMDDVTGNNPRRLGVGIDTNRLSMLLAVLHKHARIDVGGFDVYVNAVGGIRATEPAADLSITLALLSSLRGKALPADLCCFGEMGLTGEVRPVQRGEDRLREAVRLGFKKIMVPKRNMPHKIPAGIELVGVSDLSEAAQQLSEWG